MYRRCQPCNVLVPLELWQAHQAEHRRARQGHRAGRGATKKQKAQIKARDGMRCTRCRSESQLEVHHVNGLWRDNRPENLVTLCADCHRKADAQVRQTTTPRW